MFMKLFYSAIVVFVAFILLVWIWELYPFFGPLKWVFEKSINLFLSLIVLGLSVVALWCIWCTYRRVKKIQADDSGNENTEDADLPYPNRSDWKCISDFSYETNLKLARLKTTYPHVPRESQYIFAKDYTVSFDLDGRKRSITVPKGLLTDLASVPSPLRFLAGRVGPHLESCLVHDYLYCAWQKHKIAPTENQRRFADDLMLEGMYKAETPCWKARGIYWAVRLFGSCAFFRKRKKPYILNNIPCCKPEQPVEC